MSFSEETLKVPSMRCGHCQASIEGALRPLPGVADVAVKLDVKEVVVRFDHETTPISAIVDAIEAQGFEVVRE